MPDKYDFSNIEKKWQKKWLEDGTYEPDLANAKKPFYNLMMFPYPSAEGLHVGNMYAFTGADIYGRMKRMQGYDVFEPIGLDGFGIHSENYALKIGAHPMDQTKKSEENFYRQLGMIGNGFAWKEKLETYDPDYYKWTQWIFTQLWKAGLAYRKKQSVNWCPSCKTVLADEQVITGRCERCGTAVVKKDLEQWFFRITKYAGRLLDNLEKIDWSERVKIAQRNWIGRSEGASIKFPIFNFQFQKELEVFTTRPDTLFGTTFMVISPELARVWIDAGWQAESGVKEYVTEALSRRAATEDETEKEKTGVFSGVYAVNPVDRGEIPVWVSDYVLAGYGTGAIMAVPAHDERDFEFAKKFKLPIVQVIKPEALVPGGGIVVKGELWEGDGVLVNSGKFDGMSAKEAIPAITDFVGGKLTTQYRLRDWLISRQRYWGAPIPMIHCGACEKAGKSDAPSSAKAAEGTAGWYAVREEDLPVTLPRVEDFRPKGMGESPLASVADFYEVKCPGCGGAARRETDVSDTFLDSAWYYIGYLSQLKANPFSNPLTKKWLPVSLYTGGAEHSVLHLLYVRFLSLALHDMGLLEFGESPAPKGEPFPKFRAHGLLIKEGAKMSKSKGNVINPDEYITKFGADALRMYLMFLAPWEQGGDFRDEAVLGIVRFIERVWKLFQAQSSSPKVKNDSSKSKNNELERAVHKTIKKVTEDIEALNYNTAVSALMILLNEMEAKRDQLSVISHQLFLKLLAPFAPHLTEELWHGMGNTESIHRSEWPAYDPKLLIEETATVVVQVNGKHRGTLSVPAGAGEQTVAAAAKADPNVMKHLTAAPKKVIFVPDRLINFVL